MTSTPWITVPHPVYLLEIRLPGVNDPPQLLMLESLQAQRSLMAIAVEHSRLSGGVGALGRDGGHLP